MNHQTLFRILLPLLLLFPAAHAQYRLPEGTYTLQPGALEIHSEHYSDTYIFGLGWTSGANLPDPVVIGQAVSIGRELLALVTGESSETPEPAVRPSLFQPAPAIPEPAPAFQGAPAQPVTEPATARISNVRFGGSGEVRVVFDVPDLHTVSRLAPLTVQGSFVAGQPLVLQLPAGLLAPFQQSYSERGVNVSFSGSTLTIAPQGSGYSYSVFAIADPVRLVVDLTPSSGAFTTPAAPTVLAEPVPVTGETVRSLAPGVSYLQFRYPNGSSTSAVHVLKIAPGSGQFRVVGSSRAPATLSELARGSIVAINAGYFNTTTHDHIGLLRTGGTLDSLPSLGRASIGFNGQQAYIARTTAEVIVRLGSFRQVSAPAGRLGIEVFEQSGSLAGDAARGVIIIEDGVATANRMGPVHIPEGGTAIAYDPELRDLALVDPGERISFEIDFDPGFFNSAQHAVEAGPLLVDGGRPAFDPALETFALGQRILDDYTAQSAIGIMPDGTILMVVAETMRAQDLVPLFLSLGASQAMRLDSGGSAALYAGGEVLNRSVQRRIVSAIVLGPG